jgi:Cu/Ag efflux pump CusA
VTKSCHTKADHSRRQAEDYRIDQKEIDKHFLKGIAASAGIVIGKTYVFQDIFLLVERRAIVGVHAEKEITRLNRAILRSTIAHITCDIGPMKIERKGQERIISITAHLYKRDLGSAVKEARKKLAGIEFPEGFSYKFSCVREELRGISGGR